MKGILSKPLEAAVYRRLVDAWSDPALSLAKIVDRFRVTPNDVKELKRVLGLRPKPPPLSPWWKQGMARARKVGPL